jgi:hypothetical protein
VQDEDNAARSQANGRKNAPHSCAIYKTPIINLTMSIESEQPHKTP